MREFARLEIIRWKCLNCGSRNKVYTELVNKHTGKHAGKTLKCCNCGRQMKFLGTIEDEMASEKNEIVPAGQYCIRLHFCPIKNCPLRNKKWWDYVNNKGETINPETSNTCDNNCDSCGCMLCNKNQNYTKLHYNTSKECCYSGNRFR